MSPRMVQMSGCFAVLLLGMLGCSREQPPLYPVSGKVTMNGAAPVGGSVILHPEGQTRLSLSKPTAVIGNDGSFTVRTNYQDGAPVGRYKVTFFWAGDPRVPKSVPPQDERSLNQNQIPHPYSSVADTPFSIEVAPEANVLPLFQLRSDLK